MNEPVPTRLSFRIHYATQWGEDLLLERRAPDAAGEPQTTTLPMQYAGGGYWSVEVPDVPSGTTFEYRYRFESRAGSSRQEPLFRQLHVSGTRQVVLDQWFAAELPDATFLRQAFPGIIFQPATTPTTRPLPGGHARLRLTLRAPRVPAGFRLCLSGNHPLLGQWDPTRALVLSGAHYPLWEAELPLAVAVRGLEYKFGLWQDQAQRLVAFETGENRRLEPLPQDPDVVTVNAESFRHDTPWKGAGVAIPVFALRSERGYGVGEFADLAPFAEWAAGCGLHLVQLLPVNDTSTDFSWRDSYPYKAISSAALHPVYLNLDALHAHYRRPLPPDHAARRDALNALPEVDYERVMGDKLAALRALFADVGATAIATRAFRTFFRQQADWLKPYAAFCWLRDRHGTADFAQWGEYATYAATRLRPLFQASSAAHAEVMFHAWVQFHLRQQLDQSLKAGHARGVAFKGDLPIGIDRHSVEAWTEPGLFHMDRQTGAPPDNFSALGQNWGFPTYNWQRMEADGYAWWRRRFRQMSGCFDALRIDHILGFFRIWEIPAGQVEGILGHFNPALPLTREEIWNAGFHRDPAEFAVGTLPPDAAPALFAPHTELVRSRLFAREGDDFHRFRPEFETAPARRAWCDANLPGAEAEGVAKALDSVEFDRLFVRDPEQPARFHPRINLMETRTFEALPAAEREVLRRLHDDYFYRRHSHFWEGEAMKKLPALMDATGMLICGEDLGMIPDAVPVVLGRLGLLSLEVQRLPKQPGQRFADPRHYPYLSVCTTSTHDLPTIRGMWAEEEAVRRDFHRDVMGRTDLAPAEATVEICRFMVEQHLASGSMWCVLPLQDWLALDNTLRRPDVAAERINVPANPRHYWRYRMHLTIENLARAAGFNRTVAQLVGAAGR